MLLGSMLAICFLCTYSDSYCPLQSVYYSSRRYCTLQLVQVGISPFGAVLGAQPFYSAAGVHTFSTAGLGIILPFLRRLVLSSPVVTGAILQQSALLQARPSLYSAVGGETALFGRYTTHVGAVGIAITC